MNSSRCAACKHLRRRCPSDCIFSPYFPSNNPRRFAHVHKIFGASNVGKILQDLPENRRAEAAETLYYEASYRIQDPVYGCVKLITILDEEIHKARSQLARVQAHIASLSHVVGVDQSQNNELHQHVENADPDFFPPQNDASNSTSFNYDLSTWFD